MIADPACTGCSGLAVVLGYVGLKLFTENIEGIYHPGPLESLAVIAIVLTVTVVASLRAGLAPEGTPPSGVGLFRSRRREEERPPA